MSRKHVINYYKEIESQYFEMLDNVKDMEEAINNKFLPESKLEGLLKTISTLKSNYTRLSYIVYLLDLPNKPNKEKRNSRQYNKLVKTFKELNATKEDIFNENLDALKEFKKQSKKLLKDLEIENDKKESN